ncbi:hypothetical protein [Listeria seeligeri]|uniref:hypothetical protein n=1 Tax=Listeria seeligeri TaxID=1640 RepID=UPI001BDA2A0D|nr:hypothetical protein [Listeria seeligeri]MBT0175091.1 hypothetical protein [Listeria seeligeri]
MDENSYQLEQQLQTLQKQQREAETTLEALKREQNDQAWLEEDFSSWRKQFQAKEAEMQTKLASCQKTMHQLENQQRSIRKELIQ